MTGATDAMAREDGALPEVRTESLGGGALVRSLLA